ncbi:MAG: FAD-binding oxidoreductase [Thermoguttaceae bacterium]|nr:FAD-binding oxidoreductase [Thermoguttaceae bacterium]
MSESLAASQARLQEDLRGLVRGDVRCDEIVLQLFSSDGGPFQERPTCVVWPRSTADVAAVVQYAAEKKISVHPRGSGSSGGCGAIGSGIILDFSRYMRRLLRAGDDDIVVQPGAIRERVNEGLRSSKRRFFAPSSGHVPVGTIGSILAADVTGPRWLRYGSPNERVLELTVVDAAGKIWNLRPFQARPERGFVDALGGAAAFRRTLLDALIAEADAASNAYGAAASSSTGGFDFGDGGGFRSFRSDVVREDFFRRFFGSDARAVRDWVRGGPWSDALRAVRAAEPFLDAELPPNAPSRRGYPLRDVVRFGVDPTRFFVGSEGTLGIIAEARLATSPLSNASAAAIFLFDSLEKAARAVPQILEFEPTLCDLLDGRVVALTRDWDARFEAIFPQTTQAALVVELDADSDAELRRRVDALRSRVVADAEARACWTAFSSVEKKIFRDLLRKSSCARLRMAPSFQIFPYWEDVRLPVEAIPDFLSEIRELFKRERLIYSVGGFVGCGQLSIRPILPYSDEEESRAFALSERVEELVLERGGDVGAAKGHGRVRTAVIPKRFPNLFPAFVRLKDALDPENRLNPDCVVSPEMRRLAAERARGVERKRAVLSQNNDAFDVLAPETDAALRESSLHSRTIRQRTPFDAERLERDKKIDWLNRPTRSQLEFQLAWNPTLVYSPTFQCVGCGHCRIRTDETRMCPAFRNAPDEKASCRAKANFLRGVFDGDLDLSALKSEDARRVAEYCVRCHSCASECPAQVDVPRLAFRLQSAYQAANGLSVADLFAVRFDGALRLAARFSGAVDAALRVGAFRWALEKTLGLARRRRLPRLESRPYLSRLPKAPSLDAFDDETAKTARRRVVLFVDSFANFFDAALIDAAKSVLELNGVDVVIPPEPRTSGAVSFARGDVDGAERVATRNVSIFRELLRSGAEIVALEPSSAVCIKREYPYFCDDADAKVVYANTTDVCSYLARLDRLGELNRDALRPLNIEKAVGYHAPCRTLALTGAALSSPTPAQTLLEAIPDLKVRRLERGCCGLANYSGFLKTRYSESLRLGARLFLAMRDPAIEVCSSECSLCNLQLLQGVDKRARESSKRVAHVLKLLAASYGLLPLDEAFVRND